MARLLNLRDTTAFLFVLIAVVSSVSVKGSSTDRSVAINGYSLIRSPDGTPTIGLPLDTASFDLIESGMAPLASGYDTSPTQTASFASRILSDDDSWLDTFTLLAGLEGSKQPQDFGVNAALGGRFEINGAVPVYRPLGIGLQLGTATVASDNAVRVFELVGEDANRYQQYVTVGLFQRTESGFAYGFVYDYLYQDSFDTVELGQWRGRVSMCPLEALEIGSTVNLRSLGADAVFGTQAVHLRTIDQMSIYARRYFSAGVQGAFWMGIADEHGESNAVTGPSPSTDEAFLFGADILAPITANLAIYGETNLIMPADTGTVDAFMGLVWYPGRNARRARQLRYSPLLPMAASTSFSVDLLPR